MESSSNSGRYILTFAVVIVLLNIVLVIFLFLNEKGIFNSNLDISSEHELVSEPVSPPVSSPV